MSNVIIYTANHCLYCVMAKRLFASKQVSYTELNIDKNSELRAEMLQRTKRRTVPQIYIGDVHVGGFDDLHALDKAKKLDDLLARPGC
ncbi:glutaredoxin 3 [Methylobacter sp.]|uniref:glutaredoxin 3 n=1 Tax=Methylobacter sp. TaxID=2051955 RepID=UPI003DA37250